MLGFLPLRCADPRPHVRGRPSRPSAQTSRRGRSAAWRVRASSPPIPVPCGMAGSLRDWQPHGRAVARVGVYGGALERRCVPSGRADPLCGSMYGVWVPDTCGPFHTRIASKTLRCEARRTRSAACAAMARRTAADAPPARARAARTAPAEPHSRVTLRLAHRGSLYVWLVFENVN